LEADVHLILSIFVNFLSFVILFHPFASIPFSGKPKRALKGKLLADL